MTETPSWVDLTLYGNGGEPEPKQCRLDLGPLTITVSRGSDPTRWFMYCWKLGFYDKRLKATDIENAKLEALCICLEQATRVQGAVSHYMNEAKR